MTDDFTAEQRRGIAALAAVYPLVQDLGQRFTDAGHELYLVGGTVRDAMLGRSQDDLDFATSADPRQSERLVRGWADHLWLTGARFGTVSAHKGALKLEITTFRADTYTPGSRHPKVTFGSSIDGDLSRRDFTINAMAMRLPDLRFTDPFGGLRDLRNRILRTPIDPRSSFGDDPLRMVRLARFAATLEAEPDDDTRKAATDMAAALDSVSRERIRDELSRLVVVQGHARGIELLCETGLADRFLPEIPALRMERDPLHRHKDVYAHTLAVVDRCVPHDDLTLRLAALLHDIGKPATRAYGQDGKVTFHHHEVVGARMAERRLKELRYPHHLVDDVSALVRLHLRFHGYADDVWTDSAVRRYVRDAGSREQLARLNALTRADVTTQNRIKARRFARRMDDLESRIAHLEAEEEIRSLRPALDGRQIMDYLGLEPGPLVGKARSMLLDARLEQGPMSEEEAYLLLDTWAEKQGLR
ncbi:MAG: CCA tRNA nucleotidyltransferase [Nitriliruptorales bacterium]|nr:CCA tRNA nucleotidyltransferase [Nitriliruptorales bacterium]